MNDETYTIKRPTRRSGKALAAAAYEVCNEVSAQFQNRPVTAKEAAAYCRVQLKRHQLNLDNAKLRRDKRAAINLERKLAISQYMLNLVEGFEPLEEIQLILGHDEQTSTCGGSACVLFCKCASWTGEKLPEVCPKCGGTLVTIGAVNAADLEEDVANDPH